MAHEDKRFVRFSSIEGIHRADSPLAAEIWLEDLGSAAWADRNTMKLATLLARYVREGNPNILFFRNLEYACGLDRQQVTDTMRIMQLYGVVEGYDCHGDALRASLVLSFLQRLKILEARKRFFDLRRGIEAPDVPWQSENPEQWVPQRKPV